MESNESHELHSKLFLAPCRCLLPPDLADVVTQGIDDTSLATEGEVPALSDRVAVISGLDADAQTRACRRILANLREALGVSDMDSNLFVILVPCAAAGAVVGTRGQRVKELIKNSGAIIDISREVLPGLEAQPVTLSGTLEETLAAVSGVQLVIQELVDRGRLRRSSFDFVVPHGLAPGSARASTALSERAEDCDSIYGAGSSCAASNSLHAAPVRLLMAISAAGRVIGKQGRTIATLQENTGARISLLNEGVDLPGLRCGERLFEIVGETVQARNDCVRAVLNTAASVGDGNILGVLVPANAVGHVIGRNGQSIEAIRRQFDVKIDFRENIFVMGDFQPALISGSNPDMYVDVVLALVQKIDASCTFGASVPLRSGSVGHSTVASAHALPPEALGPSSPAPWPGLWSGAPGQLDSRCGAPLWATEGTAAEKAVLAGLHASGITDCRLSFRMPKAVLAGVDLDEIARQSGARLQVSNEAGPGHCLVTAFGAKMATSLAALHMQEQMSQMTQFKSWV